ncbi:hypothetical protein [Blastopirellula retiformator]|uniref:Uncharacterized protein n=1 Tax=Blastopirellula retiformator TaxID=2527970 RepID=A0A5C5VLT5_9BACT|nr:hypothetical protein [Blastopirellula retiformator]TWT38692.1 hypothetical protein Enr8_03860 [Blastopirellula retiformator]
MTTRAERIQARFRRVIDAAKQGKSYAEQAQAERDQRHVEEACRALMPLISRVNISNASAQVVDQLLHELVAEFCVPIGLEELQAAVAARTGGAPPFPLPSQQITNAISEQTAILLEALRAALQEAKKTADSARSAYIRDLRDRN